MALGSSRLIPVGNESMMLWWLLLLVFLVLLVLQKYI